ncbi:uncharacterized protein LOC144206627 [Stigmatopora nigra]
MKTQRFISFLANVVWIPGCLSSGDKEKVRQFPRDVFWRKGDADVSLYFTHKLVNCDTIQWYWQRADGQRSLTNVALVNYQTAWVTPGVADRFHVSGDGRSGARLSVRAPLNPGGAAASYFFAAASTHGRGGRRGWPTKTLG